MPLYSKGRNALVLPTPPWLFSILEEHFEEIQMLWELRRVAARDPDYRSKDLQELDERIAANVDGLLINIDHAEKILLAGLASGEMSSVFAATFVFLFNGEQKLIHQIVNQLCTAEDDETINGISEAIILGPIHAIETDCRSLLTHPRPHVASVAAEALAMNAKLDSRYSRVAGFLMDDSPEVRRRGWSIVSCVDNSSNQSKG